MNIKAWLAEFFGTFGFVFVGVMAVIIKLAPDTNYGEFGVAMAHGIGIAVMASATMAISGGHLNPAVSFGAWIANRLSFGNLIGYVVAQVLGGLAAVRIIMLISPASTAGNNEAMSTVSFAQPLGATDVYPMQLFATEAILAFFLMFVVLGTALDKRAAKMSGLYIGLAVFVLGLAGSHISGGCFNPARYLASSLLSNYHPATVYYVAGPILGAAVASIVYQYLLGGREWTEEKAA